MLVFFREVRGSFVFIRFFYFVIYDFLNISLGEISGFGIDEDVVLFFL